jgi:hypothetical protein
VQPGFEKFEKIIPIKIITPESAGGNQCFRDYIRFARDVYKEIGADLSVVSVFDHGHRSKIKKTMFGKNSSNDLSLLERRLYFLILEESPKIDYALRKDGLVVIQNRKSPAAQILSNLRFYIDSHSKWHEFSPAISMFFAIAEDFGFGKEGEPGTNLPFMDLRTEKSINYFNDFIEALVRGLLSKSFNKKIRHQERRVERNKSSLLTHLDCLLHVHGALRVVGIDLSYQPWISLGTASSLNAPEGIQESHSQLSCDVSRFLNDIRSLVGFAKLVGYCRKVEFSPVRGFFSYFIFYFSASETRAYSELEEMIAGYWEERITAGRGRAFGRDCFNNNYKKKAPSWVADDEFSSIERMKDSLSYMAYSDWFWRVSIGKRMRVIERSNLPDKDNCHGKKIASFSRRHASEMSPDDFENMHLCIQATKSRRHAFEIACQERMSREKDRIKAVNAKSFPVLRPSDVVKKMEGLPVSADYESPSG